MSASVVLSSKDPHVKNPLKAFFNERGYQVIIEGQGSSALLKTLEKPVDLFINDFPEDDDLNLDIIEDEASRPHCRIMCQYLAGNHQKTLRSRCVLLCDETHSDW